MEPMVDWFGAGGENWLVVTAMSLVVVALLAHALGKAHGRRIERREETTRSSLEAAVHGVPDRRGRPARS